MHPRTSVPLASAELHQLSGRAKSRFELLEYASQAELYMHVLYIGAL